MTTLEHYKRLKDISLVLAADTKASEVNVLGENGDKED